MFKKIVAMVLCMVAFFTLASFSVSANGGESSRTEGGVAKWSYISARDTRLSISSSGTATCTGSVTGYPGTTTKVEIYLYLQQYKNGAWSTVSGGSWYQLFNSYKGTLQKTKSGLASGYQYRLKASYYAWSGSNSENVVAYSSTVSH